MTSAQRCVRDVRAWAMTALLWRPAGRRRSGFSEAAFPSSAPNKTGRSFTGGLDGFGYEQIRSRGDLQRVDDLARAGLQCIRRRSALPGENSSSGRRADRRLDERHMLPCTNPREVAGYRPRALLHRCPGRTWGWHFVHRLSGSVGLPASCGGVLSRCQRRFKSDPRVSFASAATPWWWTERSTVHPSPKSALRIISETRPTESGRGFLTCIVRRSRWSPKD